MEKTKIFNFTSEQERRKKENEGKAYKWAINQIRMLGIGSASTVSLIFSEDKLTKKEGYTQSVFLPGDQNQMPIWVRSFKRRSGLDQIVVCYLKNFGEIQNKFPKAAEQLTRQGVECYRKGKFSLV